MVVCPRGGVELCIDLIGSRLPHERVGLKNSGPRARKTDIELARLLQSGLMGLPDKDRLAILLARAGCPPTAHPQQPRDDHNVHLDFVMPPSPTHPKLLERPFLWTSSFFVRMFLCLSGSEYSGI